MDVGVFEVFQPGARVRQLEFTQIVKWKKTRLTVKHDCIDRVPRSRWSGSSC